MSVYEYFTFDGKSSRDFEVWISGSGTFGAPERDVSVVSVPGRNGDLSIDNGRYKNIDIKYPAFIVEAFRMNFDGFKAWLESKQGYKVLTDTYHPEYYRMARVKGGLAPSMGTLNRNGTFDIVFDCDPRRFLNTGKNVKAFTASGVMKNPTLFDALPLLRVYGTGTVTIGSVAVKINTANEYTDIDCDMQEAYKGTANCNNNVTLSSGEFPKLSPGSNNIYLSGVSKVEITPRYWTI